MGNYKKYISYNDSHITYPHLPPQEKLPQPGQKKLRITFAFEQKKKKGTWLSLFLLLLLFFFLSQLFLIGWLYQSDSIADPGDKHTKTLVEPNPYIDFANPPVKTSSIQHR